MTVNAGIKSKRALFSKNKLHLANIEEISDLAPQGRSTCQLQVATTHTVMAERYWKGLSAIMSLLETVIQNSVTQLLFSSFLALKLRNSHSARDTARCHDQQTFTHRCKSIWKAVSGNQS